MFKNFLGCPIPYMKPYYLTSFFGRAFMKHDAKTFLHFLLLNLSTISIGCSSDFKVKTSPDSPPEMADSSKAIKLTLAECLDPDLTIVPKGVKMTLCDGSSGEGQLDFEKIVSDSSDSSAVTIKRLGFGSVNPNDIRAGVTILGVKGTLDLSNLTAGNIKSGVSLAGVTGAYPSTSYPLAYSSATADLDLATFNAKIKSAANFEWFDSAGNAYVNTGDPDISASNIASSIDIFGSSGSISMPGNCTADGVSGCITTAVYKSADTSSYSAWDIRKGKTIGGVVGNITFYKNMANTALAGKNRTAGTGALAGVDPFDTIDDFNANGAFPTEAPAGFDQATGANWTRDTLSDTGAGGGGATDGVCNGSEACVYLDNTTGLRWSRYDGTTRTWENAITYCDGLNYGGYTDWRLPTQKELQQAYVDGIWSTKGATKLNLDYDHMSATRPSNDTGVWTVCLAIGCTYYNGPASQAANCVR